MTETESLPNSYLNKFIELFAGIGGFRYGLERNQERQYEQFNNTSKQGLFNYGMESIDRNQDRRGKTDTPGETETGEGIENKAGQYDEQFNSQSNKRAFTCVYANEWDRYAASIYEKNFGERPDTRDITTVDVSDIPDHDLLCGGFPCQAFSIAGKRQGFDDTRGTLFFEIARILKAKRPRYCLLENVKGLLSHDGGRTFQIILQTLDELGYDLQWQVLNSKNFSVPQNRERVFIIGHIRGERRPEVFPIRESYELFEESRGQGQVENKFATAVTSNLKRGVHSGGETLINVIGTLNSETWQKRHESIRRVYGVDGVSPTIPTGTGGGVMTKIADFRYDEGLKIRKDFISPTVRQEFKGQDISKSALLVNETNIRRLTPVECERLQGFPDNYTKYGIDDKGNKIEISDTQRYKCLGNAVTTTVITEIGKRLLNK